MAYLEEAEGPAMSGAEEYAFFLDTFLDLYANHKDLPRFNRSFDIYVQHEGATAEQMASLNASVDAFANMFHAVMAKGRVDCAPCLDITERAFFVTSMYTMLAVATTCAEGLVWPTDAPVDHAHGLMLPRGILYATYVT